MRRLASLLKWMGSRTNGTALVERHISFMRQKTIHQTLNIHSKNQDLPLMQILHDRLFTTQFYLIDILFFHP